MKVLSEIEDFSEKLNENSLAFNFNPSVAHWKDNLYLVCYRTYVKNISNPTRGIAEKNQHQFGHPWHTPAWNSKKGYDKTGFCIMKIVNNKIVLEKTLNDGNSIYYFNQKSDDKHMEGVDARLIKIKDNSFLVSYNKPVTDNLVIKDGANCLSGCVLIATRVLTIIDNNLDLNEETILCNEISKQTEKNWSFFNYDNKFFFSYGLSPTHLIYSFYFDNDKAMCGKLDASDKYEYYGNYEKYVNPKEETLYISVSTPAIPSRENRYIGVGHVKFLISEKKAKLIKAEPFQEFYQNILDKRDNKEGFRKSFKYDYLMFLYEFEPRDGHITRISDMFIPDDSKYLLVFPTGLIYVGNELWIFYGDHDSNCKIIKINNQYVEKILKETPNDKKAFYPGDINYFIFPKTCMAKTKICELLLSL